MWRKARNVRMPKMATVFGLIMNPGSRNFCRSHYRKPWKHEWPIWNLHSTPPGYVCDQIWVSPWLRKYGLVGSWSSSAFLPAFKDKRVNIKRQRKECCLFARELQVESLATNSRPVIVNMWGVANEVGQGALLCDTSKKPEKSRKHSSKNKKLGIKEHKIYHSCKKVVSIGNIYVRTSIFKAFLRLLPMKWSVEIVWQLLLPPAPRLMTTKSRKLAYSFSSFTLIFFRLFIHL